MQTIRNDLRSFSIHDWIILAMVTSIFLPHTLFLVALTVLDVYILWKDKMIPTLMENQTGKKYIYLFLLLSGIVSLINVNGYGLTITLGFLGLFAFIGYYQGHIHEKLFMYIIEWTTLCSLINGMYALVQFAQISHAGGYSFFDFHIFNSPKRRIMTTFQNANIYALMLDMVLACILYRFLQTKKVSLKIWYVILALFQFGLVLLTGCRSALVPLVIVIPILLICFRKKILLGVYCLCLVGLLALIIHMPTLIPRFDDTSTITSRFTIWSYAWEGIKQRPLFGRGPWTFHLLHPIYKNHIGSHAHNVYIDMVLSHGIVGTGVLAGYVGVQIQNIKKLYTSHRTLFGLILALTSIVAIMGLVDGTIEPLKTMMFFMMIVTSYSMKK